MGMPNNLVLVRHGQSEGNVAFESADNGDESWYTDAFTTTPGHQWRLSDLGRAQAATTGLWLAQDMPAFDRFYTSVYVRARETAGTLSLSGAQWRLNRALRERDWGEIEPMSRKVFASQPEYRFNAVQKEKNPLYWVPPGGESIAMVAEDRVRNVTAMLHRECGDMNVVMVGHGELFTAFRLVIERLDDRQFFAINSDSDETIKNAEVLHYTRIDPTTGKRASRLAWLRRAWPVLENDVWVMRTSGWRHFDVQTYSNEDLLAQVAAVPQLFPTE